MGLTIYNTLTNEKTSFQPRDEKAVKMYVCGPTVYDLLHVGNFRGAIFFNLVCNWLEHSGMKVTYVYNYTDVDDKIIKKAKKEGVSAQEIGQRYIKEFRRDFERLKLRPHDHNPKVTEFIPQIIKFVEDLIKNASAYVVEGEVFYSVESFKDYGKLSGKDLEGLELGHRVEKSDKKKHPADFVLWKPSSEDMPGWESPWGRGRPGWHIECSSMISELLGETIDIHGGGIDLIFPHHENEIAQGEGRSGRPYCRYWMHNNFINFQNPTGEQEKMSKSLGNVISARQFMDDYHPEILKYLVLSAHYRSILSLGEEPVGQAMAALGRVYHALRDADEVVKQGLQKEGALVLEKIKGAMEKADKAITLALNDDFNTVEALANIFEVIRCFNSEKLLKKLKDPASCASAMAFRNWVIGWGDLMALFQEGPHHFLDRIDDILLDKRNLTRQEVDEVLALRNRSRAAKDWDQADRWRKKLTDWGIEVVDRPGKESTWRADPKFRGL